MGSMFRAPICQATRRWCYSHRVDRCSHRRAWLHPGCRRWFFATGNAWRGKGMFWEAETLQLDVKHINKNMVSYIYVYTCVYIYIYVYVYVCIYIFALPNPQMKGKTTGVSTVLGQLWEPEMISGKKKNCASIFPAITARALSFNLRYQFQVSKVVWVVAWVSFHIPIISQSSISRLLSLSVVPHEAVAEVSE